MFPRCGTRPPSPTPVAIVLKHPFKTPLQEQYHNSLTWYVIYSDTVSRLTLDGLGCDKNMLDCPALSFQRVTQSTPEGLSNNKVCRLPVFVPSSGTLSSPNECACATWRISEEERLDVIRRACSGSNARGGMLPYEGVSLQFTPHGQYYRNRPGSSGLGPPVLF